MKNSLRSLAIIFLLVAVASGAEIPPGKPLRIGIVDGQLDSPGRNFSPFTQYLNSQIEGAEFRVIPFQTIDDLLQSVERRQTEFAFITPVAMVELNVRYGARAIATVLRPITGGTNYPWLAGAVFVLDSRKDIQGMADLRGKRVIALSPLALGGWLSAVRELRKIHIRDKDLESVAFEFSYSKVVQEVCEARQDAGVLSAAALMTVRESCQRKLRVLPRPAGAMDRRYPTPVSTALYPGEAFAVTGDLDESLVSRVASALFAMKPGTPEAKVTTVAGFTPPLSYVPVQQLMEELRLRPFENYGRLTFRQAAQQFGLIIAAVFSVFLAVLGWALKRSKDLNRSLESSEKRYREIVEGAMEGIFRLDLDGKLVSVNPAFARILGYESPLDVLDSMGDVRVHLWLDQAEGIELQGELRQHGIVRNYECQSKRKDGSAVAISLNVRTVRGAGGSPLYYEGFIADMSDRRRFEDELRLSNFTLENASVGVIWGNLQGRFTRVNRVACAMTGYSEEELLAMSLKDLDTTTAPELAIKRLRQSMHFTFETIHRCKDGQTLPVEVSASLIKFDGSDYVVSLVRDISERKAAEAERDKLQAQLIQAGKMESVGRLAGGVAHDFNNLLTVINGYSELAIQQTEAYDPVRRNLEEILKAGESAAGLTRQLLAYSRRQVLQLCELDLNGVVENMRGMLFRLVGEDVELSVALSRERIMVRADEHGLEQVIMNLAVNARDAMPQGGQIKICTAVIERFNAENTSLSEIPPGRYAVLTVSDSGVGIDEVTRQHIFEPFFTTKGVGKGTGLGLATAQGIVAQIGGYINVSSESGNGSTFVIDLPLAATQSIAGSILEEAKGVVLPKGHETILLVEDQADVCRYATAALEQFGYTVVSFMSPADAMAFCESHGAGIDLLLTDVVMPGISGPELAARLTEMRPQLKVLFMSGYTGDRLDQQGVANPGWNFERDFIQKPFKPIELAEKVQAMLAVPLG